MRAGLAKRAFIGIGANLGDPQASVRRAVYRLSNAEQIRVLARSSMYLTVPMGRTDQPDFVNAVVEVETDLDAVDLLDQMQAVENELGRVRTTRNAPRTIDLDLLIFGDQRFETPRLTLPHPRMTERAFVLVPLVEIAADVAVGESGTAEQLLANVCTSGVKRIGDI